MKGILVFFIGIGILGAVLWYLPPYKQLILQSLSYSACDTPLQYNLGSIDPKFGLSNNNVVQDIQDATNLWNNAEDKELFALSPKAPLVVNFVYDERSSLNSTINNLQSQLSQKDTSLQQQIADYESQVAAFKQKLAAFNAQVDKYNQQGGAPQDVYNQLRNEQDQLNQEGNALNQTARQLKLSTNDYNGNVSILNGDITQFKNELAQKPEEGLYNGTNNTITIYFANSHIELLHTLAHEFGHALGMVHVGNPQAIMYAYTTSSFALTPDDMQQLQYVCRKQSTIIHLLQEFDVWMITMAQNVRQSLTH